MAASSSERLQVEIGDVGCWLEVGNGREWQQVAIVSIGCWLEVGSGGEGW